MSNSVASDKFKKTKGAVNKSRDLASSVAVNKNNPAYQKF